MKNIDDKKILELHQMGYLQKEIAKELGCGVSTVTSHLLKMGIKTKKKIDRSEVLRLHKAGKYDREIAEMLGCSRPTITTILNCAGYSGRRAKKDDLNLRGRISDSLIGRYTGANNPNYKGGTKERWAARGILKTISRRRIRECNYTCQACGKHGNDMEAHHIKPFNVIFKEFMNTKYDGNMDTIYEQITSYPDFMDETNVVVLCHSCHRKVHYSDDHELSPYRWESATTIENTH